MKQTQRKLIFIAALIGLLAVAFGAFGAHALKGLLSEAGRSQYDLGVRYAFIHGLAIFAAAIAMPIAGKAKALKFSAGFFMVGVVLFSGSLILLALSQQTFFAILTPLGGLSFILGWGFLAYGIRGD